MSETQERLLATLPIAVVDIKLSYHRKGPAGMRTCFPEFSQEMTLLMHIVHVKVNLETTTYAVMVYGLFWISDICLKVRGEHSHQRTMKGKSLDKNTCICLD